MSIVIETNERKIKQKHACQAREFTRV